MVATPDGGRDRWIATARRVEELGYTTLLMPDGMQRPGPSGGVLISAVPALAVAAGVTEELRVGTFVMASPLRAPMAAAWDVGRPHRVRDEPLRGGRRGSGVDEGFIGADAATLIEHDSLVMLRGSVTEMCDELQRRRDAFGTSCISVNGAFSEQLAPVVAKLAGQ